MQTAVGWRKWVPPRWVLVVGTFAGTFAGLKAWDKYRIDRERALLVGEAKKLADEVMPDGGEPRRVLVMLEADTQARYQFRTFIKPVFDAAALDYSIVKPANSYEASKTIRTSNLMSQDSVHPAEGIVVVGVKFYRAALDGLHARIQDNPEDNKLVLGFAPMRHAKGFMRWKNYFDEASAVRYAQSCIVRPLETLVRGRNMGEFALAIAEGFKRPMETRDLQEAEKWADLKNDRLQTYEDGALVMKRATDYPEPLNVQVYSLAPERLGWRDAVTKAKDQPRLEAVGNEDDYDTTLKMPTEEEATEALAASTEIAAFGVTTPASLSAASFKTQL